MSDSSLTPPALRHQREQTIVSLCEHFAQDHLEVGELEQMIDRAHHCTTVAELEALVHGLPELKSPETSLAERGFAIARPGETSDQQMVVAIMSGNVRKGSWSPARNIYTLAVMGGADLDFREARLAPGVTEMYCLAIMGGVDIVVPPGLRVESNGMGIMGAFEHIGGARLPADESEPVLRITGIAVMGAVEITQREIGESARAARKRLRKP
ncbi:DUF1707 domain-containing protein [soil metagenome]